ncbi:Flagellin D [Moorella humiferrea]|uniref:flagellin N-terminal helical domain-containing protein n=1 Tax=Neomoorella humiferrea TaxID=676965 RepID=UPI0030D390DF
MRINQNISALNAYRNLTVTNNALAKSMEKLSSGLRINRAADDAAGLAISEKMRGQIRGLNQAVRNAQDGISLIQTAEGALTETHSILQRMRELAVQSANDTNTATDRWEIQKEINQLSEELTRIANTTEFNTKNLLGGGFQGTFQIGANKDQNITLQINGMKSSDLKTEVSGYAAAVNPVDSVLTGAANLKAATGKAILGGAYDVSLTAGTSGNIKITVTIKSTTGATITLTGSAAANAGSLTATGSSYSIKFTWKGTAVAGTSAKLYIVGKDENGNNQGISVITQADANRAITIINNAIETVSAERSKLGAYQNRLEHTIANLGTAAENLTAAESRIRDLDMAQEMMAFTRNQILSQAGTAMLAQANAQPQTVLQLLR